MTIFGMPPDDPSLDLIPGAAASIGAGAGEVASAETGVNDVDVTEETADSATAEGQDEIPQG